VFIIGIDPHKGTHTAVAIDGDERLVGELLVRADRRQRERLLCWAAEFEPRLWAVEGATGTGALLSQQLVRAGETVLDVPPALSARARLLDSGHKDKTDAYDARSAAERELLSSATLVYANLSRGTESHAPPTTIRLNDRPPSVLQVEVATCRGAGSRYNGRL
jgi:transposase